MKDGAFDADAFMAFKTARRVLPLPFFKTFFVEIGLAGASGIDRRGGGNWNRGSGSRPVLGRCDERVGLPGVERDFRDGRENMADFGTATSTGTLLNKSRRLKHNFRSNKLLHKNVTRTHAYMHE